MHQGSQYIFCRVRSGRHLAIYLYNINICKEIITHLITDLKLRKYLNFINLICAGSSNWLRFVPNVCKVYVVIVYLNTVDSIESFNDFKYFERKNLGYKNINGWRMTYRNIHTYKYVVRGKYVFLLINFSQLSLTCGCRTGFWEIKCASVQEHFH